MKKALIFDPYLDTLGGGERYALTFALGLIKYGYSVVLAWPNQKDLFSAETRFGMDLSMVSIDADAYNLCSQKTAYTERLKFTKDYDLIFWVSDGSLPFLFSKNNLIHLQVPFKKLGGNPTVNNLKTVFIHKFVRREIRVDPDGDLPPSLVLFPSRGIDGGEQEPGCKGD